MSSRPNRGTKITRTHSEKRHPESSPTTEEALTSSEGTNNVPDSILTTKMPRGTIANSTIQTHTYRRSIKERKALCSIVINIRGTTAIFISLHLTKMNLWRFIFTIVGCHQCSDLVKAFVPSRLLHSRSSSWDVYATLESLIEEEHDDKLSPEELIDEAVLLYSIVSQRTGFDDNTEADNDILKLRGGELTRLIEDSVFDARGIVRGGAAMEDDKPTKEPETLSEISQALDDQILLGYETTFTEEELEKWIEGIDALQQKLQSMLAALPPGSDITTEAKAPQPPTPLDQLYVRLGTMRTLIDPVADHRLRLPLAQLVVAENNEPDINGAKSEENKASKLDIENAFFESMNTAAASRNNNVAPSPKTMADTNASVETKIPAVEKKATKPVPSELELENALIGSMNKAAENDAPSELELENALIESMNKAAEDDPPNELEMENSMIEAMNKAAEDDAPSETTTELELENASIDSINKAPEQNDAPTKATNELELENALIEAMNKAAENEATTEAPSELELENTLIESMNKAADDDEPNTNTTNNSTATNGLEEHSETAIGSYEGADVISTVAMAAAVGATAVTKLPLVLAGVALGPVIRNSVAYAKSRTKKFKEDRAELEAKEKKNAPPKPKAWSAFDPKPNKKVTPKDNSNSDSGKE